MYKCEAIAVFVMNKDLFHFVKNTIQQESSNCSMCFLSHKTRCKLRPCSIKSASINNFILPFCGFKETVRIYLSTVIAMLCWLWIIGMLDPFFFCSFCLFCVHSIVFCLLQFTLVFVFLSILIAIVFSCFFFISIHFICMVGNSFII